jgi:hypothetical protein
VQGAATSSTAATQLSFQVRDSFAEPWVRGGLDGEPQPQDSDLLSKPRNTEPSEVAMRAALGMLVTLHGVRQNCAARDRSAKAHSAAADH